MTFRCLDRRAMDGEENVDVVESVTGAKPEGAPPERLSTGVEEAQTE